MAPCIFWAKSLEENLVITIDKKKSLEEFNHLKALRLVERDEVLLINGLGVKAHSRINTIQKTFFEIQVESIEKIQRKFPMIAIAQSVIKNQRMDWLIEKLSEIGVDTFYPIHSQYSALPIADINKKIDRWNRLVIAAMKQSNNPFFLKLKEAQSLDRFLKNLSPKQALIFLDPAPAAKDFFQAITDIRNQERDRFEEITILIGPEGGFSEEELKKLSNYNSKATRLQLPILRGETAGIIAAAVCTHIFDVLN